MTLAQLYEVINEHELFMWNDHFREFPPMSIVARALVGAQSDDEPAVDEEGKATDISKWVEMRKA